LFTVPGLVLLGLGLIGFFAILPGPLPLGRGAKLDVHSLLVGGIGAVVGFQLIVFGLFTRLYAMAEGLIPSAEPYFTFGRDVVPKIAFWGGLVSFISGAVLLGATTLRWFSAGFPDLDYAVTMRSIIPAVTLIAIGAQAVFAGLFLGLITLHRQSGNSESSVVAK
jgi:hypothetical protein